MNDADLDRELDARLAALESRTPGRDDPPMLKQRARRGRFVVSLSMAPLLVLGMVATVAAGAVVVQIATPHEGIQNPGQPLAGAHLECMTPPQAAAFLAERGYTDVVWQVEAGDPGDGKTATTSTQQATPPEHGHVMPGSILDDGQVIMIVDQRVGATGVGDCF